MLGFLFFKKVSALINGPRRDSYGPVYPSFKRIADLWNGYLDDGKGGNRKIEPEKDVPWMMTLTKAARDSYTYFPDNMLDGAGYLALGHYMCEEQVRSPNFENNEAPPTDDGALYDVGKDKDPFSDLKTTPPSTTPKYPEYNPNYTHTPEVLKRY